MGRNPPKRDHYIPQMLLKNFCDGSGRVWVGDGKKIYSANPKNVFVQGHLYTRSIFGNSPRDTDHEDFLNSIEKSYEYEERLSEIESRVAPAVQQIVGQVRQGKCPQLSIELSPNPPKDTDGWREDSGRG